MEVEKYGKQKYLHELQIKTMEHKCFKVTDTQTHRFAGTVLPD